MQLRILFPLMCELKENGQNGLPIDLEDKIFGDEALQLVPSLLTWDK